MPNYNKDTLGDRIKGYEVVSKPLLQKRTPVLIRVDGKAFHTFTRGCEKPFDREIVRCMAIAASKTAKKMQGFKLAYIQSDEATFMLSDYDTLETGAWFDYELNKLVSITASLFTFYFNAEYYHDKDALKYQTPALFDARAFNMPQDDFPNAFIWRQRDWERNSVQMLARSIFSQKELNGKKVPEMLDMIRSKGQDWESLSPVYKYGTFIKANGGSYFGKADYEKILEMVEYNVEDRA